jgi:Na+/proline symporter
MQTGLIGFVMYFFFAFVPMYVAYSATLVDPQTTSQLLESDSQQVLPSLVLNHMPVFAQVMFFGALLSAIMSTASGALLAPSVTFTENIMRPMFKHWTDEQFLWAMRFVVIGFPPSYWDSRSIPRPISSKWSRTPTR